MERSLWTRRLRVPKRCQNLGALMWLRSQKRWTFFLYIPIHLPFVLVMLTHAQAHVCTHTHTHTRVRPYIFLLYKINGSLVKSLKTLESIKQKISGPSLQEPFSIAGLLDASRPHAHRMCRCPLRLSPSRVFFYVLVFMLAFSLHVCSF